jgi:hypothetical protein
MSTSSSLGHRPTASRPGVLLILLLTTCALALGLVVAGGAATHASVSAGTTPTGGSGATDAPATTLPSDRVTGYDEDGSPHADTAEERTGRDMSPGRLAFIIIVVLVTLAVVGTLAVRARRKRAVGEGDLQ